MPVLILVAGDVLTVVAVAVVGGVYGYRNVLETILDWRAAHPWSYLPSIVTVFVIARRYRRARKGKS